MACAIRKSCLSARWRRKIEWIKDHLASGESTGARTGTTSEYSRHSRYVAAPGLLLVGDAFAFLDPVFSKAACMLALKSGVLAGEEGTQGARCGDLSPARFQNYSDQIR